MTLKDLLKKKNSIKGDERAPRLTTQGPMLAPDVPEITFLRTTTNTQSIIEPPSFPGDAARAPPSPTLLSPVEAAGHRRFSLLRHRNSASNISTDDGGADAGRPGSSKGESSTTSASGSHGDSHGHGMLHGHLHGHNKEKEPRLSERLGLGRSRSTSSVNVPDDLPDVGTGVVARNEEEEARWEKRATMLARGNSVARSAASTPGSERPNPMEAQRKGGAGVGMVDVDKDIQEAIRLHEDGDLEASTKMFERLADPNGENHPLSQVLFGLALRHGWGCEPDVERAITYLSYAASNSAEIESMALSAGMKKGGAAKGELVLAMYELANCFRNGWGIKKDPVAAKQYYETAANLGDTDAMNEVAWCYLEGFGCKKDKFKAAQFLRLAEQKGSKTLGNTWIWKDKYNPK